MNTSTPRSLYHNENVMRQSHSYTKLRRSRMLRQHVLRKKTRVMAIHLVTYSNSFHASTHHETQFFLSRSSRNLASDGAEADNTFSPSPLAHCPHPFQETLLVRMSMCLKAYAQSVRSACIHQSYICLCRVGTCVCGAAVSL